MYKTIINILTTHGINHTVGQQTHQNANSAYHAQTLLINDKKIELRTAKITPKKNGQFVALWRRAADGSTRPYHINDSVTHVIIQTSTSNHQGAFIFTQKALIDHKIFSTGMQSGKRGFRLYPAWDTPSNTQARTTQKWQLTYFVDCTKIVDERKVMHLLQNN